jgi:tRNA-2-methylthio-N6-dimethylallyladenosine synthase
LPAGPDLLVRLGGTDAAITSDFIVATPGESEAEFERTLELMREVRFDASMTAAYSPRPNTPMALWPDQLSEAVKEDRLVRINRLVGEHALAHAERYLGKVEEVLVEERNTKRPEQVIGRTRTNRLVFFAGEIDELRGRLVQVRITEARKFSLTGELVGVGP